MQLFFKILFFIFTVHTAVGEVKSSTAVHPFHKEAGFIEIFIDNQAQTPVYYDNMTVTHTPGRVLEINTYYPYGMIIPELSAKAALKDEQNWYKYSGKELQKELNLNVYDFGNRIQDPMVGRFWTPDRFAEKYYHLSPYSYAGNNPINYIDINGDSLGYVLDMIRSGLDRADQFVSKASTALLTPIFGRGTALNNLDIKMKGNTYGEWEGHADGDLSGGNVKDLPDYGALTISGNFVVGGGVGGDINLGYVKRDGIFVNATGRTGSGFDISAGIGLSFGSYRGDKNKASAIDLSGVGLYENVGVSFFNGGAWQDISNVTVPPSIGQNWIGGSAGISIGSKSFYGGSVGASYTTKPLYIYKIK